MSLFKISLNKMTLSELKIGETAYIIGFDDKDLSLKLMEMGCLPGEKVELTEIAPLGDPIAFWVAGYKLSIRKSEARQVLIKKND